jgi:hypothetical protein
LVIFQGHTGSLEEQHGKLEVARSTSDPLFQFKVNRHKAGLWLDAE